MTNKEFENVLGVLDDAVEFLEDLSKKAEYNGKNNSSYSFYTVMWDKDKSPGYKDPLTHETETLVAKLKTASNYIKEALEVKETPESNKLDPAVKAYRDLMLVDEEKASRVESLEVNAEGTKIRFDKS